jgi:hypothetical protein
MLRSKIMPPRYIRYHRIRRDRFRNDPTLLFITPSSAPNHPRYLRAAPNNLRVVTNVDHNVHTIHDPKRITIVHHSPPTQLCGVKTPLTEERRRLKIIPNAFGERAVLKLMFGALIHAAERLRSIKITEFERRQLTAARKELDQEYETQIGLKHQLSKDTTSAKISSTLRT